MKRRKRALFLLSVSLCTGIFTGALFELISCSIWNVLFDTAIWVLMSFIFYYAVISLSNHGSFSTFPYPQNIVNNGALALCATLVILGINTLLELSLFGTDYLFLFLPILPIKAIIIILIFIILILYLYYKNIIIEKNQWQNALAQLQAQQAPAFLNTLPKEYLDRVVVKVRQKVVMIPIQEIFYLKAYGDYVRLITSNGEYVKEQTMKSFEECLPPKCFLRIHRSYIINIEAISRIECQHSQNRIIILKNGETLKISQLTYKTLKMKLNL